jgi:hypothetical protein
LAAALSVKTMASGISVGIVSAKALMGFLRELDE